LLAAQSISYLFRSNEPNWSDSTQTPLRALTAIFTVSTCSVAKSFA